MVDARELIEGLGKARDGQAAARRELHAARLRLLELRRDRDRAERRGDRERLSALEHELRDATATAEQVERAHDDGRRSFGDLMAGLHDAFTPEELTRLWSAETPVLLLPLRVETRYKGSRLLVRVFPDEISIDTHEELLTKQEADLGQGYWKRLAAAPDETSRREAWRKLVDVFGAPRSAYVVTRTRPTNWAERDTVGPDGLTFPDEPVLKEDGWTQPPLVKVLPDRLVLTLLRGGTVVRAVPGAPIGDVVQVGPQPLTADGTPSWQRGADGRIQFDAETEWLRDFPEAVTRGLGFEVDLPAGEPDDFDQLVVLGLRHSASAAETAGLVEELIAGHRYSPKGLALVPQGTATNNTSDEDAGLDALDWFAEATFAAEEVGEAAQGSPPPGDLSLANDGERLAAYLGLDRSVLARVPNADRRDHAEAVAMNTALYPGTLGFFLKTMIGEVSDDATLAELRRFATRSVTGRGPLPALRVGNQPYGLVLAGPAPRDRGRQVRPTIDQQVETVLARARGFWLDRLPGLARLGASPDGSADLLSVLGLQPTAAEYYQRIAVSYDHLVNLVAFQSSGDRMDSVFETAFAGYAAHTVLHGLGYDDTRPDGTQKRYPLLLQLVHQRRQTRIPQTSLIDGMPFSETDPITPYDAGHTKNYVDWLAANARNADALRRQDFGGAPRPTALLYLLLRHSLLIQAATSVHLWFKLFEIDVPELVTSRKFLNLTPDPDVTAWELLSAPASSVHDTVTSALPLLATVQLPEYTSGEHAHVGAPLEEMLAAYDVLRQLPTARLERLFAEHVDTLSYRIDAWETALTDRRLTTRRDRQESDGGLHLGAVGYLEGVRRSGVHRTEISEDQLPEALREGHGDLYRLPEDTAGFIHAPSLNHATAAAVLRNGYLTHATPGDPERLAVDLSSRRVRRAEELMAGVRNGQPLEVLLGIEFERGLHDATTRPDDPVVLNDLKPVFRQAHPVRRTRIPPAGHAEGPTIVPDYSVVDGLAIVAAGDGFPTGTAGLPALGADKTDELRAIRQRLLDSLDSLKDAMTTEAAYQMALGNFDRAAAVVQSLATASPPPAIEAARTSRGTDLSFTHRLAVELDPAETGNPWSANGIALTPRATLEPPLNSWVAALVGDPDDYACEVIFTEPDTTTATTTVSLTDLALQPLDLVYVTRGARDTTGPQELEARVLSKALEVTGASPEATVEIAFTSAGAAGPAAAPMADVLGVLDLAHQVLTAARPLDGRDSLTGSRPLAPGTEPSGIAVTELRGRVDDLRASMSTLVGDLDAAADAAEAPGAGSAELAAVRAVLRKAADAGVPYAFPTGADGTLVDQARRIGAGLDPLVAQAQALIVESQDATLTAPLAADKLIAAAQALLGTDFRVLPRFTSPNAADVTAASAAGPAILATALAADPGARPVHEMLTSVAHVRPAAHRLHRLLLVSELLGAPTPLHALQLPHRPGDSWLGSTLPPGHEISDDTLSVVQLRPQGFDPGGARCGLLVDEWVESLPRRTEVTGLAFNFDQPNSTPLQSLLLAVAGEGQKTWTWDGLLDIVLDTVLRAKLRAVEPDMLDQIPGVTTLVPATVSEFSTSPGALSLDLGLTVPAVLAQLKATSYLSAVTAAVETP